jgi:hypothetical protein
VSKYGGAGFVCMLAQHVAQPSSTNQLRQRLLRVLRDIDRRSLPSISRRSKAYSMASREGLLLRARSNLSCEKRCRRDEPGDDVCRVRSQFTGVPSGARSMISIRVPQGSVM